MHEQLNTALEEYDGLAAPDRTGSALMTGAAGQEGALQHASDPATYAPAAAAAAAAPAGFRAPEPALGAPPAMGASALVVPAQSATSAAAPAGAVAPGPDLIDFGDEEGEAPHVGSSLGAPAAPVGGAGGAPAVPAVSAQAADIYNDFDNLAGATEGPVGGVAADTLEGAFEGVSLQQTQPTSASENPFAS